MRELLAKVLAITDITAHWREFQTRCLLFSWNDKRLGCCDG
jgi:hypothetical protein